MGGSDTMLSYYQIDAAFITEKEDLDKIYPK